MSVMAVVQLGLAMIPLCQAMSAALISGTTSGTASSMRKALELSTTTQPALTARGANCLEMPAPALKRAMSTPWNEAAVNSRTARGRPRKGVSLPAERAEASNVNWLEGNFLRSSVWIISAPTAPVAPTMAMCGFGFIRICSWLMAAPAAGHRRGFFRGGPGVPPAGRFVRRGLAQPGDDGRNVRQQIIHLFLRVVNAQAEAHAALGPRRFQAHG